MENNNSKGCTPNGGGISHFQEYQKANGRNMAQELKTANDTSKVSELLQPKTRNFTQVPSLKSSPVQRRQLNEEDYFEEDYILQTDERNDAKAFYAAQKNVLPLKSNGNIWNVTRSPRYPLNSNDFVNAFTVRRQGRPVAQEDLNAEITNYSVNEELKSSELQFQNHTPSLHSRGQSMFEVQRSMAHGSKGLLHHQQLQKVALHQGSLGLEEHLPIQSDRRAVMEINEDDEEMYYQDDQEHLMTEQDFDGQLDEEEEKWTRQQQDSPDFQSLRNDDPINSSEGNIPKSSHSSTPDASPQLLLTPHTQTASIAKKQQFAMRLGVYAQQEDRTLKSSESISQFAKSSQKTSLSQNNQSFKINPQQIQMTGSVQQSTTQNTLVKPSSYSSFISTVVIDRVAKFNNAVTAAEFRNKDCNETVEDELEVCLQKPSERPSQLVKPPIGKRQELLTPAHVKNSRSSSEQKFELIQKPECKSMQEETIKIPKLEDTKVTASPLQQRNMRNKSREPSSSARPNLHDPETELLKQEYIKLKMTLSKLQVSSQFESQKQKDRRRTAQPKTLQKVPQGKREKSQEIKLTAQTQSRKYIKIVPQTEVTPSKNENEAQTLTKKKFLRPNSSSLAEQPTGNEQLEQRGAPRIEAHVSLMSSDDDKVDRLSHSPILLSSDRRNQQMKSGKVTRRDHVEPKTQKKRDLSNNSKIFVQVHQSKSNKVTQRRLHSNSSSRHSRDSYSSQQSSLENFQNAMRRHKQSRQGIDGLTESDTEKHLMVSNIKSSASRTNTAKLSRRRQESKGKHIQSNEESDDYSRSLSSDTGQEQFNNDIYGDDEYESSGRRKQLQKTKKTKNTPSQTESKATIVKNTKDRKNLKININMNSVTGTTPQNQIIGDQFSNLQSKEELFQRHIIQQQQFLLAAIAHQQFSIQPHPQQLMIQQQLALQQQQMMFQQQNPLLKSTSPYGLIPQQSGLTPIQKESHFPDISQNFAHAQSVQIPILDEERTKNYLHKDFSQNSLLTKKTSGYSQQLNQGYQQTGPLTQRVSTVLSNGVESTLSPPRRGQVVKQSYTHLHTQEEDNNLMPSPRDLPAQISQLIEDNQNFNRQRQQTENSHNRNQKHASQYTQPRTNDYQQKKQVMSRNRSIQQNYSSPVKQLIAAAENQQIFKRHIPTQEDHDVYMGQTQKIDLMKRTIDSDHQRRQQTSESRISVAYGPLKSESNRLLEPRRTGQFGVLMTSNAGLNESPPFKKHRDSGTQDHNAYGGNDLNRSSSDNSMDEGVTAKNTHLSINKSPYADTKPQNKIALSDHESNEVKVDISQENVHDLVESNEQDKKEPQALWIGFEESDAQVKDPFQNKPQLKTRVVVPKEVDTSNRSKSAKGTPTINIGSKMTSANRVAHKPQLSKNVDLQSPKQKSLPLREPSSSKLPHSPVKTAVIVLHNDLKAPIINSKVQRPGTSKGSASVKNNPSESITPKQSRVQLPKPIMKQSLDIQPTKAVQIDLNDIMKKPVTDPVIEDLDPNHNQQLAIEILDKKPLKAQEGAPSLADMFLLKKKLVIEKYSSKPREQDGQEEDQDLAQKKEKSKMELFQLRKNMMKSSIKRKEDNFSQQQPSQAPVAKIVEKKEPADELMTRLAHGKKPQIDQKEMKRLTIKNYHNLPEIKKKRDEEQKKQELQARKAATQEYLKQLQDTRKRKIATSVKKKVQFQVQSTIDSQNQ